MYKILKNAIPKDLMVNCQNYVVEQSKKLKIEEHKDEHGTYHIKRIYNDDLLRSEEVKKLIFYEPFLKRLKNEIGEFSIINYFSCMVNSFGTAVHRDGQSFGYNLDSKKKSKKIFKIMFYLDTTKDKNINSLDVNFFDFEWPNFLINSRIFMKLNFFYEFYFRKRIMKSLNLNIGDIVIMDSNTWHSGSFVKERSNLMDTNFKCLKTLLSFEVVTDKNFAKDYASHVKETYTKSYKNNSYVSINPNLIEDKYNQVLTRNNINTINL